MRKEKGRYKKQQCNNKARTKNKTNCTLYIVGFFFAPILANKNATTAKPATAPIPVPMPAPAIAYCIFAASKSKNASRTVNATLKICSTTCEMAVGTAVFIP